jgi:hypothetical protein
MHNTGVQYLRLQQFTEISAVPILRKIMKRKNDLNVRKIKKEET